MRQGRPVEDDRQDRQQRRLLQERYPLEGLLHGLTLPPDYEENLNVSTFLLAAASAASLFCAHGSVGLVPDPLPSGFESEFAVAVVQITRSTPLKRASVTDFRLYDSDDRGMPMKRLVSVELLDEAGGSRSHPWDGSLPAGTTRLRVRVSLPQAPKAPKTYTLVLGPYTISGACDIAWPT